MVRNYEFKVGDTVVDKINDRRCLLLSSYQNYCNLLYKEKDCSWQIYAQKAENLAYCHRYDTFKDYELPYHLIKLLDYDYFNQQLYTLIRLKSDKIVLKKSNRMNNVFEQNYYLMYRGNLESCFQIIRSITGNKKSINEIKQQLLTVNFINL